MKASKSAPSKKEKTGEKPVVTTREEDWKLLSKQALTAVKRKAFKKGLPIVSFMNKKFYFTFRGNKIFELSSKEAKFALTVEPTLENFTTHFKRAKIKSLV